MRHCIVGAAPEYRTELCRPVSSSSGRQCLRSASRGDLIVPRFRLRRSSYRAFVMDSLVHKLLRSVVAEPVWRNRSAGTCLWEPVWRNRSVEGTGLEEPVLEILSGRAGLQEPVCWRNRSRGTGLGNLVSKNRSQGTGLLAEPVWGTGLEEPVCETCL